MVPECMQVSGTEIVSKAYLTRPTCRMIMVVFWHQWMDWTNKIHRSVYTLSDPSYVLGDCTFNMAAVLTNKEEEQLINKACIYLTEGIGTQKGVQA